MTWKSVLYIPNTAALGSLYYSTLTYSCVKRFVPLIRSNSLLTRFLLGIFSPGFVNARRLNHQQAKNSHSNKMWKVVSSSSLHNLQTGFSLKMPIVCRCFLRLQWPVISPVTALICVLLNCRTLAARDWNGFPIISFLCLWPATLVQCIWCCSLIHAEMDLRTVVLVIPNTGSGPVNVFADPFLPKVSAFSLPAIPRCPGTHTSNFVAFCQVYQVLLAFPDQFRPGLIPH
jgi:hypothetical protein